MLEEVQAHFDNGNFRVVPRASIPRGTKTLPSVWSMKRKRRIKDRSVYKYKARLTVDGSRQIQGIHYWETYAPVAAWPTIRLILALVLIREDTKQDRSTT